MALIFIGCVVSARNGTFLNVRTVPKKKTKNERPVIPLAYNARVATWPPFEVVFRWDDSRVSSVRDRFFSLSLSLSLFGYPTAYQDE